MPGNKLLLFRETFLKWQRCSLFSLPLWIQSSRHWAVVGKNGHTKLFHQQPGDFHGKLWSAWAHSYKSKCVQRREGCIWHNFPSLLPGACCSSQSPCINFNHTADSVLTVLSAKRCQPQWLWVSPQRGCHAGSLGRRNRWCSRERVRPGCRALGSSSGSSADINPRSCSLLAQPACRVPGKTGARAARGAVWVKEGNKELGRLRMGLGLNTALQMPSCGQLPSEVTHWEPAGERHRSVYYPVSCSLPSAPDMRSTEYRSVGYWHILGLEIYFPFPTKCTRGFSTSAKKNKQKITTHEEKPMSEKHAASSLLLSELCLCG